MIKTPNSIDQLKCRLNHCCCCCCCCLRDSSSILVSWAPLRSSLMVVCIRVTVSVADASKGDGQCRGMKKHARQTHSKCLRVDAPLDQGGAY